LTLGSFSPFAAGDASRESTKTPNSLTAWNIEQRHENPPVEWSHRSLAAAGNRHIVARRRPGRRAAWVQRYPGAEGTKIAVDADGNVVVAGNIGSSGPGVVIKYSSDGAAL